MVNLLKVVQKSSVLILITVARLVAAMVMFSLQQVMTKSMA